MFYHNINPVLFTIGGLEIRYYGLFYVIGAIITYFMIQWLSKHGKRKITSDEAAEYLIYLIIGMIIGARVFYVVVYNFQYYVANPLEIIMVWKGGLSFHGGFIGALISGLIFAKKRGFSVYYLADITVIPLASCLFLGRIGNFINGELYGRITNVPWAVKFKGAEGFRHPSQLYESFKNLVIFVVLLSLYLKKKVKEGTIFWLFIILYSSLRFVVEFFREPDPQLGYILFGMTMGQVICIIFFIAGVIGLYSLKKGWKNEVKRKKKKINERF